MAENTGIEWAHHTFNPWIGCQKVSSGCDNCYAESWDHRFGGERWGPHAERTRTSAANWKKPMQWQRKAKAAGERHRVFCASLADVFDNHRSIEPQWRHELWTMIRQTPDLDWLLLTKRPSNITRMLPFDWVFGYDNVWLGTTVEHQDTIGRAQQLTQIPARVRFLSVEPLLGPVQLEPWLRHIHWVIAGGESGPNHRPVNPDWIRDVRDQCAAAGTAFLFKQYSGASQKQIKWRGRELDGVEHNGYPERAS